MSNTPPRFNNSQGYPQMPPQQGYPQGQQQAGYPQMPPQQGYPQMRPQTGYPQGQPQQAGYPQMPPQQGYPQMPPQQGYPQGQQQGAVYPGYSNRIMSPEFQQAVQKHRNHKKGCTIALIVAPPIIGPIYAYFSDGAPLLGLLLGIGLSVIILIFSLIIGIKSRTEKTWEGTVVNKYQQTRRRREEINGKMEDVDEPHSYVVIKRFDGKRHVIDEISNRMNSHAYHYFNVGDRVLYHARMGLTFPYEKFDKTRDSKVICAFCGSLVGIENDYCPRCHKPLLK